ncbi:MAG: hypothetical protein WA891_09030 [Acidobacteriaceae bacterium]
MTAEVGGMIGAGVAALVVGLALARRRFAGASGAGKILALGPVFEAVPLAVFAAEHFTAARELAPIVPHWLPWPLFWTYFVGTALLAAAISFIVWRHVRWSAALLALLFLIIVVTIDLPNMPKHLHDRIFWTLTVRETVFAGGAMVLAGSVWPRGKLAGAALERMGRVIVGAVMIFYGIEHFLFPRFVTGVPLEKATPAWVPAPVAIAWVVGITLVVAGAALLGGFRVRMAAAGAGLVLLLLVVCFYGPLLVSEFHSNPVEGLNYFADTLLFAGTVLLAGLEAEKTAQSSF